MFLLRILFGASFTVAASWSLGRMALWRLRAPGVMALPVGASLLSLCVYILLLLERANENSFLLLGGCALLPVLWRDRRPRAAQKTERSDRVTLWILRLILPAYGALYLVHALAPEVQPDALYYHLGLVSEYFRRGAFPDRIGFYEVLPQGMEMLYLFGFAFGEHPAAKLIHFVFLIATGPVMLAVGHRLGISRTVCWVATAFYWLSPVVGVSGTCGYTDAALVCCVLATLYFLLAWRDEGRAASLIPAGALAGFCYAIKLNGLLIAGLAGLFVLFECSRRPKLALARSALLAAPALVMIAPWMIRAAVLTGNPLAPLFNTWFPNPYFLASVDKSLSEYLRTYDGFQFRSAPWELTVGGASHGILGPLFLLLPLGLLSLFRREGRRVWLLGAALAIPWFVNVGTRFLMPSLPFFALGLALAAPHPVAWAALIFHAVSCWPAVVGQYQRPELWRLWGFPWRAALRVQPDRDYLRSALWDFPVTEMINRVTQPDGKILGLTALPDAYIHREIVQYWQSATGVRLREELLEATYAEVAPFYDWSAEWPEAALGAVRIRNLGKSELDVDFHEVSILRGGVSLPVDREWRVAAWPDPFEAIFAFDGNQASRWHSWDPMRPGMYLEVEFGGPLRVSGVSLSTHRSGPKVEIFGKPPDGRWRLLAKDIKMEQRPAENLRRATTRNVKRAGIDYILAPVEGTLGNADLGRDLVLHSREYGIHEIGRYQTIRLFAIDR